MFDFLKSLAQSFENDAEELEQRAEAEKTLAAKCRIDDESTRRAVKAGLNAAQTAREQAAILRAEAKSKK